jgi:hypothetical protein
MEQMSHKGKVLSTHVISKLWQKLLKRMFISLSRAHYSRGLVIKTATEMKFSSNPVSIHFPHFTIMNLLKCEIMWKREIKIYSFHSFLYAKETVKRKIKYTFNLVYSVVRTSSCRNTFMEQSCTKIV